MHPNRPLAYKTARRIVIAVIGGTVLLVGLIMVVTPGPAMVVIPTGLAILAVEFAWARRWLLKIRRRARQTMQYFNRFRNSGDDIRGRE